SVLAPRAASEGPRWTRAVEDHSVSIPERKRASVEGTFRSVVAWDKSASRRARGRAGENGTRSKGRHRPLLLSEVSMRKMLVRLQPTRPDRPNSLHGQNKLVGVFSSPIGLLVTISVRMMAGIWKDSRLR